MNAIVDVIAMLLDRGSAAVAEWWPSLVVVAAILLVPQRERQAMRSRFERFATWRGANVSIALLSLLLSIVAWRLHGTALPKYHDDFGYALAADMFTHGRASYPPQSLWPHFETMHVLQLPRYVAKFPPGQGLLIAGGNLIVHTPLAMVWLVSALACALIPPALASWMPASWAFLAGLLAAIHPTMRDWNQTYHGGALAALGGILLIGAIPRIVHGSRSAAGRAAIGLTILSVSRPYEGLVLAAIGFALLLVLMIRESKFRDVLHAAPAGVAVLTAGLALLGAYNHSITGSAFTLPYSIYEQTYDPTPNFIWQHARPLPHYRNEEMREVYTITYLGHYQRVHAAGGLADELSKKLRVIRLALLPEPSWPLLSGLYPLLFAPFIAMPRLLRRNRNGREFVVLLAAFAIAPFSIIWWLQTHYLAPAVVLASGVMALLLYELAQTTKGARVAVATLCVFVLIASNAFVDYARADERGNEQQRQQLIERLTALGGKHLVIVPPRIFDCVYNSGDIAAAPVIFTRDLGVASNARLVASFRDRRRWQLMRRDGSLDVMPLP